MRRTGFTLIELLAVIVILALIALIAVPIVINMIDDAKKSSEKETIKLYLDTVTKTIAKQNLKSKYEPDTCTIQQTSGDLTCQSNNEDIIVEGTNKILKIEMKGEKPTNGTLSFSNGKIIEGENILLNSLYYQIINGKISEGTTTMVSATTSVMPKIKLAAGNVTGTCQIASTNKITCGTNEVAITNLGNKTITGGTITFTNGEVTSYKNLNINGTYYHKKAGEAETTTNEEVYVTLINDVSPTGLSIGDKYTYKVNDTDTFNFYVLSIEGTGANQKVNLIMDRNICNDGTVTYTSTNSYCRYQWHTGTNDNNYGPDTAMINLYNGTKGWTNVPDMVMNYTDENNTSSDTLGYTSIITNAGTKVTTITGKQSKTSDNQTFGSTTQPLKARLPKESEVTGAGCTTSQGSCPTWLMENMTYLNVSNDKYSMNNNSEAYQNQIYGYWLLSSLPGYSNFARYVRYYGYVGYDYTAYGYYGARPVITVSTSDLSN